MSALFRPSETRFYNSKHLGGNAPETDEIDFFFYVPHGAKPEAFLAQHPDYLKQARLTREQLTQICHLEADVFTPELAHNMAQKLAAQGYRVAVLNVFLPREIIDANRVQGHSVRPTYNNGEVNNGQVRFLNHLFNLYYLQVVDERRRLINKLTADGKWLDLHSMRPFSTDLDGQAIPDGVDYVERLRHRIDRLAGPHVRQTRTHAVISTFKEHPDQEGHLYIDPILLESLKEIFNTLGIPLSDDIYYFNNAVLGSVSHNDYEKGAAIEMVKTELSNLGPFGQFDLACLEADPAKLSFYGNVLIKALLLAREKTQEKAPDIRRYTPGQADQWIQQHRHVAA